MEMSLPLPLTQQWKKSFKVEWREKKTKHYFGWMLIGLYCYSDSIATWDTTFFLQLLCTDEQAAGKKKCWKEEMKIK